MKSGMLLYMTELLEPAIAVAAFIRLFSRMDPDVLYELVIAGERFETLLALMGFDLVAADHRARSDTDP